MSDTDRGLAIGAAGGVYCPECADERGLPDPNQ